MTVSYGGTPPGITGTHYGGASIGVLGAEVPADGLAGPGYIYNGLTLPDDAAKRVRGVITTWPAAGLLVPLENSAFTYTGPEGFALYRLYVDGVASTVDVGEGPGIGRFELAGGEIETLFASAGATGAVAYAGTAAVQGIVGAEVAALVSAVGAVTYSGTVAVAASVTDTPMSAEPVTLAEAKQASRISDTSAFDEMIPGLITAARQLAEQETGRELVRKTRRSTFSDWPASNLVLPVHAAEAVAISYWGTGGWTALDGSAFAFYELGTGTGIAPAVGTSWPSLSPVAGGPRVRVDVTAGPADPTSADACIKLYIKALVAWWIDNPSAAAPGNVQPAPYLRSLLDPVRLWA